MGNTAPELIAALHRARERLLAAIGHMGDEELRVARAAGAWTPSVHLVHLLRTERLYTERARRALAEHEPVVNSTGVHNESDPELAAALRPATIVMELQATRHELIALLEACDARTLDRAFIHERLGRTTVRQMVEKIARHEDEHAAAVAAVAAGVEAT